MNTIVCAGGTGIRDLESVLHLCAAGLGPSELRILLIDPDGGNGNFTRLKSLLNSYVRCYTAMGEGKLGAGVDFFQTKLDLLSVKAPDGSAVADKLELQPWSPVQATQKLSDFINYSNLKATRTPPDVVRLFFTGGEHGELNQELDQGFRGHPAIGAAAMSLVSLWADRPPWSVLLERIRGDIDLEPGSRVFIAASVFGGTGAAAIHPIARFLKGIKHPQASRIKVGVAAVVPYFRFAAGNDKASAEMAARSQYFSLATRSAVEFYDYLRKNDDWPFDAVYWVGDSGMMEVDWALGGPNQHNPAHFVDLLAALACLEFYRSPIADKECYYSGPRSNIPLDQEDQNQLEWPDVPLRVFKTEEIKTRLLRFHLCGAAHLGFFAPMLGRGDLDARDYCVPWYRERFTSRGASLHTQEAQDTLGHITEFFAEHHFPWWAQISGQTSAAVRLFNQAALTTADSKKVQVDLGRMANLLWPDKPGAASPDQFDEFFADTVAVGKDKGGPGGVGAYFSVLAHAASAYIEARYKNLEASHA